MTTDTAPPPPPPPAAPQGQGPHRVQRLTRAPVEERLVGGVAAGLAEHFGLDPIVVRVAFVVTRAFGGMGVALYVALWLLLPERDTGDVVADRLVREGRRRSDGRGAGFWIGAALLVLAGVILFDGIFDGQIVWAFVLIVVGWILFRSDDTNGAAEGPATVVAHDAGQARAATVIEDDLGAPHDAAPHDAAPHDAAHDAPPVDADGFGRATVSDDLGGPTPPGSRPVRTPRAPRPPRPAREPSVLGRLTLGVLVLWVATAWLAGLGPAAVAGGAMVALGLGLVVGAWRGRARWLLLVGVLLVPFVAASMFVEQLDVPRDAGVGSLDILLADGQDTIDQEWFAGEVRLDLGQRGYDPPDAIDARLRVGLGDVRVLVPEGWSLVLDARVDGGEIVVHAADQGRDDRRSGLRQRIVRTYAGDQDAPTLTLTLDVDFGNVEVHRISNSRTTDGDVS